jgi:FAD dependent oxidoreductase TIGR03364
MRTAEAEGCTLLTATEALARCPELQTRNLQAALWGPHDIRLESREAIPALTAWLAREFGVRFLWETAVRKVDTPTVHTSHGPVSASAVAVCPGDDLETLYPERMKASAVSRCTLQMMRLESPGFTLPGTVMSDLSLVRYGGFASLPEAGILRERLQAEQAECFQHDIHLLIAQSDDGSLVVGDSHHYDPAPVIFAQERVSELVLAEFEAVTGRRAPPVRERWTGTYSFADREPTFIETPAPQTRLVMVTSGIGASAGFAIGEQVIAELFD